MRKDKIDIIIPAYKAHKTMFRCLSAIVCQTVVDDITVTIVNDCCPEGDYGDFIKTFAPYMDIKEIRLSENRGPGVARQTGIDSTDGEFIAFCDADDTFLSVRALEILRDEIQLDKAYKCASSGFISARTDLSRPMRLHKTMVWVFGKLYRRDFLDEYNIRFLEGSRANEDSGFNHIVGLLCDNPDEQIRYVEQNLYYYRDNPNSITKINNGQYWYDQCTCGGIDNTIYAIEHVRKYKPFSQEALRYAVGCMMHFYAYYVQLMSNAPSYTVQLWEYIKKYYHRCYKPIENYITDECFRVSYSRAIKSDIEDGTLFGVIPKIAITEFMRRLQTEEYDPNLIYEIWEEMREDPEFAEAMKNNVVCGVCAEGYTERPKEG